MLLVGSGVNMYRIVTFICTYRNNAYLGCDGVFQSMPLYCGHSINIVHKCAHALQQIAQRLPCKRPQDPSESPLLPLRFNTLSLYISLFLSILFSFLSCVSLSLWRLEDSIPSRAGGFKVTSGFAPGVGWRYSSDSRDTTTNIV